MVTKTLEELEVMTPDQIAAYHADEELTVFGRNKLNEPSFTRDKNGKPVEQGIGAPGRETGNHFASIRKYEGEDAYFKACSALWKSNPDHAKKLNLPRHRSA
jgi:hypothetical protein